MVNHLWLVVTYSNSDLPIQMAFFHSYVKVYKRAISLGNL